MPSAADLGYAIGYGTGLFVGLAVYACLFAVVIHGIGKLIGRK